MTASIVSMTSSNFNTLPQHILDDFNKTLSDNLTEEINEEIIFQILYPEFIGLSSKERKEAINRQRRINDILGIKESFEIDEIKAKIDNLTNDTVDIEKDYCKKTFKLVDPIKNGGYIWAPYIMIDSVPLIKDGEFGSRSLKN